MFCVTLDVADVVATFLVISVICVCCCFFGARACVCVVMCEWMDGRLCHDPAISIVVSFITNNNYMGRESRYFHIIYLKFSPVMLGLFSTSSFGRLTSFVLLHSRGGLITKRKNVSLKDCLSKLIHVTYF